jgi:peptide deformylase
MQIITPPHDKVAIKIEYPLAEEIIKEAKEILDAIKSREIFTPGSKWNDCYAVAQPQISKKPLRYFVINPERIETVKDFEGTIIINPKLISKDRLTRTMFKEGCLSFPFRPVKKTKRFLTIEVEYDIINNNYSPILTKKIKKQLTGLTACIFQHELQHLNGKNIYN